MADVEVLTAPAPCQQLNVADRLTAMAARMPTEIAVACPSRRSLHRSPVRRGRSGSSYATISFAELDAEATRIAQGLAAWGVPPGTRLALLVRPGIEFVALVFALLRGRMAIVLIDPGLGRRNLIRSLSDARPEGFVAVPAAHAARLWFRRLFPEVKWNVTVGRRWFWGGMTLDQLRRRGVGWAPPTDNRHSEQTVGDAHPTRADDAAAIIFTSGSTGPPKGVLYTHRMFDTQVSEIQRTYNIEPGGIDLACFPLFALFNSAMGVTTVLPEMDFARPASANPKKLLAAANDWRVTQAFASPAVWRVLGDHCAKTGERIPTLRQVFSCGAPVPADVLRATLACIAEGARMYTPYGATECLPVATIESNEVLKETEQRTAQAAGVCVGRKFESIEWRVIRITDDRIPTIHDVEELPPREIGELIVHGPQVSPSYVTAMEANAAAKINGGSRTEYSVLSAAHPGTSADVWHRTGDVGYLDERGRFWYCGRKSQRVETDDGPLFTECVEAVFNRHAMVRRSALVGIGPRGKQIPVVVAELKPGSHRKLVRRDLLELAQTNLQTRSIRRVLFHSRLPVDVRHNAKINREQLARWASRKLGELTP